MNLITLAQTHLKLELTATQASQLEAYSALIIEWNARFNLTSITTPEDIAVKHFLDSLSLLTLPDLPEKARLIDVGSGAGLPGLALKIARPEWDVTLLEATGKKVTFMETVIKELGLSGVRGVQLRAEQAGQDANHRAAYDLVVARAVARLPTLVEYLLPLSKIGGICVAMKGDTAEEEMRDADFATRHFGGEQAGIYSITLPGIETPHYLVRINKVKATPPQFPRRDGLPKKSPLGV